MPKRITKLTPEQTAAMVPHAEKWIQRDYRLTDAGREAMNRRTS